MILLQKIDVHYLETLIRRDEIDIESQAIYLHIP